jgi:hypothetical protein
MKPGSNELFMYKIQMISNDDFLNKPIGWYGNGNGHKEMNIILILYNI